MASYIILTRPSAQNDSLAQLLAPMSAAQIINLPALSIEGRTFSALSAADQEQIHHHAKTNLIFAVSSNAARHFYRLTQEAGVPLSARPYYAAVGVSTQEAWLQLGIAAERVIAPPSLEENDSEALWAYLQTLGFENFKHVLIVRAQDGRNWFTEQLIEKGLDVYRLSAYQRKPSQFTSEQLAQLSQALDTVDTTWLISSIESARNIVQTVQAMDGLANFSQHRFVVVHARIAHALQEFLQQASSSQYCLSDSRFVLSNTEPQNLVANLLR